VKEVIDTEKERHPLIFNMQMYLDLLADRKKNLNEDYLRISELNKKWMLSFHKNNFFNKAELGISSKENNIKEMERKM
jgi:hypothetical protein